jgi:SAGA-associated factor 29
MELWTRICQDIRKSKEKFDQQASLSVQIKTLVEKITREGNSKCTLQMCL